MFVRRPAQTFSLVAKRDPVVETRGPRAVFSNLSSSFSQNKESAKSLLQSMSLKPGKAAIECRVERCVSGPPGYFSVIQALLCPGESCTKTASLKIEDYVSVIDSKPSSRQDCYSRLENRAGLNLPWKRKLQNLHLPK